MTTKDDDEMDKARLSAMAVMRLDGHVRHFRTLAEDEAKRIAHASQRAEATPDDLERAVTTILERLTTRER